MPSLRQRVSTYFRQLSFIAEPREERVREVNDGSFITKYLEGSLEDKSISSSAPEIKSGKEPKDLPDYRLETYDTGPDLIIVAFTGPDEGCCGIKRIKLHLSAGPEIDYIDTIESQDDLRQIAASRSFNRQYQRSNSRSDQNANSAANKRASSRKNSIVNPQDNTQEKHNIANAKTENQQRESKNESDLVIDNLNKNLDNLNEIIKAEDTKSLEEEAAIPEICSPVPDIKNWKQNSDDAYGIAVSLYETNQITHESTGSPIADCFGIITRNNGAVLALADGVNWGDNARTAARCAVHGCIEYIDNAIFGKGSAGVASSTRDVFVSLLRSFWEAHSCILEVGGALTTLVCAVVLPLGDQYEGKYVVCACNVGDSLGYVYSKTNGVREFTQGNCLKMNLE